MKITLPKPKKASTIIATSDIAFLLLIFLVVTTSLEFDKTIDPPKSTYIQEPSKLENEFLLEIRKDSTFRLYEKIYTREELPLAINAIAPNTIIKVYADKEAPFTTIHDTLELLQKASFEKVFMLLKKDIQNEEKKP